MYARAGVGGGEGKSPWLYFIGSTLGSASDQCATSEQSRDSEGQKCNGHRYINYSYSFAVEAGFYVDVGFSTKSSNLHRG